MRVPCFQVRSPGYRVVLLIVWTFNYVWALQAIAPVRSRSTVRMQSSTARALRQQLARRAHPGRCLTTLSSQSLAARTLAAVSNFHPSRRASWGSASTTRTTTRLHTAVPAMGSETSTDRVELEQEKTSSSRKHTPYEKSVRRLYQTNLFHPVKLGLQNIEQLYELIGRPMDQPNTTVIHVAGTNGKGSVALKIAKTLQLASPSLRVGLFCSPHVSSFRERMQLNGELISEEQVVEYLPRLYDLCERHNIPATFFEITTALAFLFFAEKQADVVVLETGLGGRLDATNVVANPALSIITSIGLEHTRILGNTTEQIALEKGGIMKPDRPVLVGPHAPHNVLRQCAKDKGAGPYYTCEDVLGDPRHVITDYDEENALIAQAALTLLLEQARPGIPPMISSETMKLGTSERPPCRFEIVKVDNDLTVVLDVAHNPPAMEHLVRKLKDKYPNDRFRVVVGMSSDKDLKLCAQHILKATANDTKSVHLVEAYHPRAAKLEAMLEAEPRLKDCYWDGEDRSITPQIRHALKLAKERNEVLVVCGSVFLMAEAREALGFDEPRDSEYIAEVAGANLRHGQENFGDTNPETEDAVKN